MISFSAALLLFAGGILVSWRRVAPVNWLLWPLMVNAAFVPVALVASSWQVRAIARIAGVDPGWWKAFRVTTLGTLSGILPISSGTLVRGGAVLYWGASISNTGRAFLLDFLLWLGSSLLIAGAAALWLRQPLIGWLFVVTGLLALAAAVLAGGESASRRLWLQLLASRTAGVLVGIPRLSAAFAAIGFTATVAQAAVLTAPNVLSSALFFLPGGLGVREGLTAVLGLSIGLSTAAAFLAAAVDRLVAYTVIMLWEGGLWICTYVVQIVRRQPDAAHGSGRDAT